MATLKRSSNSMIAGVCAGIAEYLNLDVTLVRILWAILTIASVGTVGIIAYIICLIVMPKN